MISSERARGLLSRRARIRVRSGAIGAGDFVMAEGHVIAYCPAPSLDIEHDDGTRSSWSVDLPIDEVPTRTWLDVAIERFGQPKIAFPEPTRTGRRCWAWFVDGQNFHIAIDVEGTRVRTWAGSPGRLAELRGGTEPTDADIRAVCAYAWPGYESGVASC